MWVQRWFSDHWLCFDRSYNKLVSSTKANCLFCFVSVLAFLQCIATFSWQMLFLDILSPPLVKITPEKGWIRPGLRMISRQRRKVWDFFRSEKCQKGWECTLGKNSKPVMLTNCIDVGCCVSVLTLLGNAVCQPQRSNRWRKKSSCLSHNYLYDVGITFVIIGILVVLLSVFMNKPWLSRTSISIEHSSVTTRMK